MHVTWARRAAADLGRSGIEANEKGDISAVQLLQQELGFFSLSELADMEIQAIGWANRIGEAAG